MRREQLSNVGDKIYRLRKQNGLSQEELADKIEVSRQSVSKWETNTMTPGTEQIAALAKLFKVSIDYLILNEEDRKEVAASQDLMPAKTKEHQSYQNCCGRPHHSSFRNCIKHSYSCNFINKWLAE